MSFSGGEIAKNSENRPWVKKSIFLKSEISMPQLNHKKRNLKLMLVGTKKHIKTTCSASEIIAIYFVKIHSSVNILDFWKNRFFLAKVWFSWFFGVSVIENVIFCSTSIFKLPLRTTQNQNFAKILWGSLENVLKFPKKYFWLLPTT